MSRFRFVNKVFRLGIYILPVIILWAKPSCSQTTLYDETFIPSIYLTIPSDSLSDIYNNPELEITHAADFVFVHGNLSDTMTNVGFRLRGNTSRFADKKSFKISFNEYVSGRKYQGVKKLNLNGQHNDPTMVREKLFYHTWKAMGLPERRANFVKVYINGTYYGLYTNLEELDKLWLTRNYVNNNGNLYKCTYPADMDYLGSDPQTYKNISSGATSGGRAYDLQTNETFDDYTDLVTLITALYSPQSMFQVNVEPLLIYQNMLKALAIDVATGNWDDYAYNKNNYFLYINPNTHKCDFITYDADNTFGIDWLNIDWTTRDLAHWANTSPGEKRPLAVKLLQVPGYFGLYTHYLDSLTNTILLPANIFPYIDSIHDLVRPAAIDDTYRTMDYGYTINDFDLGFTGTVDNHSPYGIKPFLEKRRNYTNNQLMDIPEYNTTASSSISAFPLPANDLCYVKATDQIRQALLLLNLQGVTVREYPAPNANVFPISLGGLSAGIYFLKSESFPGGLKIVIR